MSAYSINSQSGESTYINDPFAAVSGFLGRSPVPSRETIGVAKEVLVRGSTRNALGKCVDLSHAVSAPTLVLAEMFNTGDAALPPHWNQDPEKARTVLSMIGNIELGVLR